MAARSAAVTWATRIGEPSMCVKAGAPGRGGGWVALMSVNKMIGHVRGSGVGASCTILRSTEEAVRGAYYGPGLQLPTEREA